MIEEGSIRVYEAGEMSTRVCHKNGRYQPTLCIPRTRQDIVFTKQNSNWVISLHNDALVIIGKIANKNLYKVLVDIRASCNLLEYSAFKKMKLLDKDLEPVSASIYRITKDSIRAKGMI